MKSEAAFRTISEVSEELNVPQHVLRFWESKFAQIKPMKRGGGRRYYRPEDLAVLMRIRDLLYKDGFTIRGAQKFLRESGKNAAIEKSAETQEALSSPSLFSEEEGAEEILPTHNQREELEKLLVELSSLRELLISARK